MPWMMKKMVMMIVLWPRFIRCLLGGIIIATTLFRFHRPHTTLTLKINMLHTQTATALTHGLSPQQSAYLRALCFPLKYNVGPSSDTRHHTTEKLTTNTHNTNPCFLTRHIMFALVAKVGLDVF